MVSPDDSVPRPGFGQAVRFWLKFGLISFGGPAGQIAILHAELVEKRRWISERRFLHALNFCMLLPGPEAQQLATYIGWSLHGIRGGVAAGVLFVLPSALLIWALSWLAVAGGDLPWIAAIFYGLQPAVIAIVAAAVLKIGGRSLRTPLLWVVAALAFVGIFFFQIPFVVIIVGAAVLGLGGYRFFPAWLPVANSDDDGWSLGDGGKTLDSRSVLFWRTVRVGLICAVLWAAPVVVAGLWQGWDGIFAQQGKFFSSAALMTFGGAYAVLPYVAQQAVENFGWLTTAQMMSGLALAESTPGPLIMVLQYVGFLGAWQNPGTLPPLLAATLGAAITTWTTFLPSFLFVLTGAPFVERLGHVRAIHAALTTITAAVVGVILNLAVWFLMHALFPAPGRFDGFAFLLAVVFFAGLWRFRWSTILVILAGALFGLAGKLVIGG